MRRDCLRVLGAIYLALDAVGGRLLSVGVGGIEVGDVRTCVDRCLENRPTSRRHDADRVPFAGLVAGAGARTLNQWARRSASGSVTCSQSARWTWVCNSVSMCLNIICLLVV